MRIFTTFLLGRSENPSVQTLKGEEGWGGEGRGENAPGKVDRSHVCLPRQAPGFAQENSKLEVVWFK